MSAGRRLDARQEAAAEWASRLSADHVQESDWLAYELWLKDAENLAAANSLDALMATLLDDPTTRRRVLSLRDRQPFRPPARRWAVFAGVVGATALAAAIFLGPRILGSLPPVSRYSAPADASLNVALIDGSTLRLNRGAAIDVAISNHERRIAVIRGEVAFNVVHDPARPFFASVRDAVIEDLGTEFDVLSQTQGFRLTVRQGVVSVHGRGLAPVSVPAGRELDLDLDARTARIAAVDPGDAFAWTEGRLVYHDASLATIVDDLNRYAETPIRIVDSPPSRASLLGRTHDTAGGEYGVAIRDVSSSRLGAGQGGN